MITMMALLSYTLSVKAQKEQGVYVGPSCYTFITEGVTDIGPELSFGYKFDDSFKAELSGMYMFEKDNVTRWSTGLSMMYLRHAKSDKFVWFPLAGIRLHGAQSKVPLFDGEKNYIQNIKMARLGVDLGIGCEYFLSSQVSLFTDFRYHLIIDGASNTGAWRIGLYYHF